MKILNGLFAFAAVFLLTLVVFSSSQELSDRSALLWWDLLFFWHACWYVTTKSNIPSLVRFLVGVPLACVATVALMYLGGYVAPSLATTASHFVMVTKLAAIGDVVFCLLKIKDSLPESLFINRHRIAVSQSAPMIALPMDTDSNADE